MMITEHASISAALTADHADRPATTGRAGAWRRIALSMIAATALSGCSTVDWFSGLGSSNDDYATASIPTAQAQPAIQTGVAAWDGDISAPGMSAAHPFLMPGSWARVTNVATGQAAVVRISRTMAPVRGRDIELSRDAAAAVGALQQGVANVLIEPIDPRQATPTELTWTPAQQPAPTPAPVRPVPQQTARFEPRPLDGYDPNLSTATIPGPGTGYRTTAQPQPQSAPLRAVAAYDPHYLQLGSFRDRVNAERLANQLTQEGLGGSGYGDAFVETAYIDGSVFHRVRLGPLESSDLAQRALQQARALGHNGARILKP